MIYIASALLFMYFLVIKTLRPLDGTTSLPSLGYVGRGGVTPIPPTHTHTQQSVLLHTTSQPLKFNANNNNHNRYTAKRNNIKCTRTIKLVHNSNVKAKGTQYIAK
jgi:hypothetical protein